MYDWADCYSVRAWMYQSAFSTYRGCWGAIVVKMSSLCSSTPFCIDSHIYHHAYIYKFIYYLEALLKPTVTLKTFDCVVIFNSNFNVTLKNCPRAIYHVHLSNPYLEFPDPKDVL